MVDPFSDFLRLVRAQSVVSGGFTAGGDWAIRFPPPDKIKFFGVVRGECRLRMDDREPLVFCAGDVFLLTVPCPFTLSGGAPGTPEQDAHTLFADHAGRIVAVGERDDMLMVGGHVQMDPMNGRLLADMLPPLMHVHAQSPQAAMLQWLLEQLVRERIDAQPGAAVASAQLAQLVFIQFLRTLMAEADALPAGWLRVLADARLAPALRQMHGDPAHPWRLTELAKAAAMSRTTFAARFRAAAGVPPLTYLANWRMRLAERALRDDDMPVSSLALSLGYASESAFSNAFKRITGMAPRRYREMAQVLPVPPAAQAEEPL